jgi:class 3 adenylate cyclase
MASSTALKINPSSAVCAKCRTLQPASSNFCGECGTRLGASPAMKPSRCASRRATVLFCDVVGYTPMAARLDPEAVFALMEQTFGVVLDAVHRRRGTVNQFLGDGAMAIFDDPRDAIAAGFEMLEGLRPITADARRRHDVEFGMRFGVHTGTVAVGTIGVDLRVDYAAVGSTTRVAASLLRVARRGEIVTTETTRRLTDGALVFEPRGEVAGNDGEPVAVHAVVEDAEVAAFGWRYERAEPVDVPDALYA